MKKVRRLISLLVVLTFMITSVFPIGMASAGFLDDALTYVNYLKGINANLDQDDKDELKNRLEDLSSEYFAKTAMAEIGVTDKLKDKQIDTNAVAAMIADLGQIPFMNASALLNLENHVPVVQAMLGDGQEYNGKVVNVTEADCVNFFGEILDETVKNMSKDASNYVNEDFANVSLNIQDAVSNALDTVVRVNKFELKDGTKVAGLLTHFSGINTQDIINVYNYMLDRVDSDKSAQKIIAKGFLRYKTVLLNNGVAVGENKLSLKQGTSATLGLKLFDSTLSNPESLIWVANNDLVSINKNVLTASTTKTGDATVKVYRNEANKASGLYMFSFSVSVTSAGSSGGGGGGGGGGSTPPSSTPISDKDLDKALEAAKTADKVVLSQSAANKGIALTVEQFAKIKELGKPIQANIGQASLVIPPDAIPASALEGARQVQFGAAPVSQSQVQDIISQARNSGLFSLAGDVFELSAVAVDKDGKETYIREFNGKIQVSLPVPPNSRELAAQGKLTVCRYNEQTKSWEDLKGTYDAKTGTITFETDRFSKYAVMEVKEIKEVPSTVVSFNDIKGHWAQKDIEFMAAKGFAGGVGNGQFAPEANITRAQFAAFLVRVLGVPETNGGLAFSDVKAGDWYYSVLATAYEAGLIKGVSADKIAPNQNITREQMAVMIVRAMEYKGKTIPAAKDLAFTDKAAVSQWAVPGVSQSAQLGLIGGFPDGSFAPQNNATRAQAIVILHRVFDQIQ